MTDETNQSARCTLKTAYTIYIENVKTLEIGKDIRDKNQEMFVNANET